MSPFREKAPPIRAQIVMIVVMALGLVGIIAFKDRCVGALTQGLGAVAPTKDGGAAQGK
jgi:hypothetical protein